MRIEKVYYLRDANTINIALYNELNAGAPDSFIPGYFTSIILSKQSGSSVIEYECKPISNVIEIDSNSTGIITIPVQLIAPVDGVEFTTDSTTNIKVIWNNEELRKVMYTETQFYPYKLAIIDSGYSKNGDIRSAKKLARFSFYEQMLINAADLGLYDDASIYMTELERMATYGVPYVKRDNCYL